MAGKKKTDLRYNQDFEDKKTGEHCRIMRIDKYIHYRVDGKKTQAALFKNFIGQYVEAQKWKIYTLQFENRTLVFTSITDAKKMKKILGLNKYIEPQYKTKYKIKEMILNVSDSDAEE